MSKNQNVPSISIIVPVFNEAQTLKPLYYQIRDVFSTMGTLYEIVFVDDGSTDGSFAVMEELYRIHQDRIALEEPLPNDSSPDQDDRHPTDQNASFNNIIESPPTSQVIVIQFRHNMGKAAALAAGFAHATTTWSPVGKSIVRIRGRKCYSHESLIGWCVCVRIFRFMTLTAGSKPTGAK